MFRGGLVRQFSLARPALAKNRSRGPPRIQDLGGTKRDQDTLRLVINKVREVSPQGLVKVIRDGQNLGVLRLKDAVQRVDLSQEGYLFMGTSKDEKGETIGILKATSQQLARKQLSDHLQQEVALEFQKKNPRMAAKQQKQESKQREPDVKFIRVSWQITLHDLNGQKRHEIETQIKKGDRVRIEIDDKDNFDKDVRTKGHASSLSDLEHTKRSKIETSIDELLQTVGATFQKEGKLYDKISYEVKPSEKKKLSQDEKKQLKQQKKLEKQEKLRLRTELKKSKQGSQLLTVD
ncbi:hypothetical protein OGAPHI_001792 [Ogataea philodendri]|uniref:Altered inheritance of mitochondria protein 23, mitochondrial n=1 Tax=Ogataea philodendri TaxID=1378263 RepID=A0A9P8P9G0_9ASCO|nr:uncharacterized protein OGAPHI_001792 [Ogataea philodendri]KAH3668038.1 hypothetical protein OGAPHI_001792 [Ogataea philodendri]